MHKRDRSLVGRRAWRILRLALLWARKGGVLKKRLITVLDPKHLIQTIRNSSAAGRGRGAIGYGGERELSFDETPVIHLRRPSSLHFKLPNLIPCINEPQIVEFDHDFRPHHHPRNSYDLHRDDCYSSYYEEGDGDGDDDDDGSQQQQQGQDDCCEQEVSNMNDDLGIDWRAEQFIAKFYQQIKLQRQISYLQYQT